MNIRFIKLLIIISLVSVINSCNKCDKKTAPEKPESTPLKSEKIEFDVEIFHQFRTGSPNPGERKAIMIGIKNPNAEKNEITKNFKIAIKLDDLTLKQVLLRDADAISGTTEDLDTSTTVHFLYCSTNFMKISFYNSHVMGASSNLLDEKFKAGNKITVTISGPDYEQCTKEIAIPPKENWP